MTTADPESHGEALDVRNSSSLLPRSTDKSCKIWGPFWVAILLENMAGILVGLIYPDLAVASLNHGVDACAGGGAGSPECEKIISQASSINAVFSLIGGILSILSIPFISSCADHFGRRPMLILAFLSSKAPLIALLFVAYDGASIYYFFVCILVPVLFPGPMLFWLWINDLTKPSDRGQMYGRLNAAQNVEGIIVPLAAFIAHGPSAVLVLAAIRVAGFLTVLCFVQESLPADMLGGSARSALTDGKDAFLARWKNVGKLFADRSLCLMMGVGMIGLLNSTGLAAVSFLYCKDVFGTDMTGFAPIVTVSTVSNGLAQLFLLKPLEKKAGIRAIFMIAIISGTCMQIFISQAPSLTWFIVVNVFSGLANLAQPAFQTVVSNIADTIPGLSPAVALGAVQAIVSAVSLLGPPIFQFTLSAALKLNFHPEAPFLLAVVLNMIAMLVLLFIPREIFTRGLE